MQKNLSMLDKIFQNQSSIYSSYLCLATERGLNVLQIHLRLHNFKGKRVKINCAPLGQVFGVKKSSTKDEAVQLEASYFISIKSQLSSHPQNFYGSSSLYP